MHPHRDDSVTLMDAELPTKRPPVRRNLFGSATPEKQASDFLKQELKLNQEKDRARFVENYGFDPVKGCPTENSKFEWSLVEKGVPDFYLKPYCQPRCKSKPVHSPRRERSLNNSPYRRIYSSRPLKRGPPSNTIIDENNEEYEIRNDPLGWEKRGIDAELLLNTPKASGGPSPLEDIVASPNTRDSPSSSASGSTSSHRSLTSVVSNSSPVVMLQQSVTDHFQVKKPRSLCKNKPSS